MAGKLEGKRVVLTGASRGIGYEIARRFLAEGAGLVICSRDPRRLERAAQELRGVGPGIVLPVVCDLGRVGEEVGIVQAAERAWGAIDILVNNAAVMLSSDDQLGLLGEPPGLLEDTLDINLLAPMRLIRAAIALLEQSDDPRIINVSSGAGTLAAMRSSDLASYRLSKWALNGLTLLLAEQLRGRVAVNALDPGWVKTDMGGPNAPGSPAQSASGALALATAPRKTTGELWKDGLCISY